MAKKEVAVVENTSVVVMSEELPDYLRGKDSRRGSENVGTDDIVIPRLELVQSLSPCRKRDHALFIDGAQEGMLYNNVTRELYGDAVPIVPVYYKKEWLVWKDRKQGGGFRGAYASEAEAEDRIKTEPDSEFLEAVDTGQHFCLLLHPSGKIEEIVISMSRSKAKVSRTFNSLIRMGGGDSFSRAYKIGSVLEKNNRNEDYFNFNVKPLGFVPKQVYDHAEKLYEQIHKGGVTIDRSVDDVDSSATPTEY